MTLARTSCTARESSRRPAEPAYLAQLIDGVPRVTNVEHYARIVKEKSLLRNLIHATHAIQQTALDAEEDADAMLDRAEVAPSSRSPKTASARASWP